MSSTFEHSSFCHPVQLKRDRQNQESLFTHLTVSKNSSFCHPVQLKRDRQNQESLFTHLTVLILSMMLLPVTALAQLVPSDTSYYVHEQDGYHYIFPQLYKGHIPKAVKFNEHLRTLYQKSFSWRLEERASLVLASERNQIANGFATVSPNTLTFFYPSGFPILDSFASPNWFSVLLAHESAHLYQLDAKSKISSLFKSILGNPLFIITPYVPVFIHPNQFAPVFMLEGNAVMNESTHGIGGRLYSGQARAQVFQLLKSGKVTPERLFNDHLYFPYGTEKYLVGGYFNAFLAEKYGVERTNQFFLEQGQRFINPLVVNKTFRNHFGKSYSQLIREFNVRWQSIVKNQKASQEKPLYSGLSFANFNHNSNMVWFLVQEDLKKPPLLTKIDKNQMKWQQEPIDLSMGKVFWVDGQPAVAASLRHSVRYLENSLYGEGLRLLPEYRSKIVQDIRGGKTAAIEGSSQFFANRLLIDDTEFGDVHSSSILSNSGDPIYFVQDKDQRTLMMGQQALFTYQGFYGYPLEQTTEGAINFIASTPLGSGLFQWKEGKIFRLSDSDLIIDARNIRDNQYIVAEITSNGYDYKIIAESPVETSPTFYSYNHLQAEGKAETADMNEAMQIPQEASELDYRNYSVLGDLRYSSTNISIGGADPGGIQGYISSTFVDPLFYNTIGLTYQRVFDSNSAAIQYMLNRYVMKPYVGYIYNEDRVKVLGGTEDDVLFYYDQQVFAGVTTPLFVWRRWSGAWNLDVSYEKNDLLGDRFEENLDITNSTRFSYLQSYPLAYEPYRYWALTLAHQSIRSSYDFNDKDNVIVGQMLVSGDIGNENYFSLQYTEGVAEKNNIRLTYNPSLKNDFVRVYRLFPESSVDLKSVRAVEASYKRPFDTPFYFPRFPWSFRRSAIYLEGGYYDAETSTHLNSWFIDYRYGVELETLLIHRIPLRIKTGAQHTTEDQKSGLLIHFSTEKSF